MHADQAVIYSKHCKHIGLRRHFRLQMVPPYKNIIQFFCIPLLVPGERITEDMVASICRFHKEGLTVQKSCYIHSCQHKLTHFFHRFAGRPYCTDYFCLPCELLFISLFVSRRGAENISCNGMGYGNRGCTRRRERREICRRIYKSSFKISQPYFRSLSIQQCSYR